MRKSLFVASLFLITSLSGCGGGRPTVIVSDTLNMVTSKEVDENMLIFNAAAKIVQKIPASTSSSKILSPTDKILVLNVDDTYEKPITVDKLKEGGGVEGVATLRADAMKAAEDGLITGLTNKGIVIEKLNVTEWKDKVKTVFYPSQLTAENLETLRTKYNISRVFTYRWVAYTPGEFGWADKPTRIRLSCRIIDTATGAILYLGIITEEYAPDVPKKQPKHD